MHPDFDPRDFAAERFDDSPLSDRFRGRRGLERKYLWFWTDRVAGRDVADQLLAPEDHLADDAFDDAMHSTGATDDPFEVLARRLVDRYDLRDHGYEPIYIGEW